MDTSHTPEVDVLGDSVLWRQDEWGGPRESADHASEPGMYWRAGVGNVERSEGEPDSASSHDRT